MASVIEQAEEYFRMSYDQQSPGTTEFGTWVSGFSAEIHSHEDFTLFYEWLLEWEGVVLMTVASDPEETPLAITMMEAFSWYVLVDAARLTFTFPEEEPEDPQQRKATV